jgi:2Fe-2S ferredoxin
VAKLIFIEHDGTQHDIELEAGKSVMQHAAENMVPGIDADCGGECACGTCHVIVDAAWFDRTGGMSSEERQMLEMTPEGASTSRLACQIKVTDALDGLVLRLPEFQM